MTSATLRNLLSLALLTSQSAVARPALALLSTAPGSGSTQLRFQPAGAEASEAPVAAVLMHAPGSPVLGALLPGTRTVLATALLTPAREESWASSLVRLEEGRPARVLVDRVYFATRPLVTASGRVFVQRGRPGPEPEAGQLRSDLITVEEVNPATGATRVLHRFEGYLAFLAGEHRRELYLYRVRFQRADLVAVDLDSGRVRELARSLPPFARDFSVDPSSGALLYTQRSERGWAVERLDPVSLARTVLATGPSPALAAQPWPGGGVALNRGAGLELSNETRLAPLGPGFDFVRALSPDLGWAAGTHSRPGELPRPFLIQTATGRAVAVPASTDSRVEVAGLLEEERPAR